MIERPVYNHKRASEATRRAEGLLRLVQAAASADLVFTCTGCGRCGSAIDASTACPSCSNRTFRVARTGNLPTFLEQPKDPYKRDTEEEGPNMTQVGGDNDPVSSSGFGQNSRMDQDGHDEISVIRHDGIETPQNRLPGDHDGLRDDLADPHGDDPIQSPAFTADESPFNPINYKEPKSIGPFNMHKFTRPPRSESVFDRIRRERKEALK
jgi:hypothetical protein